MGAGRWSLVEARSKARSLYDVVRNGGDPFAEKAATKASQLLRCQGRYLQDEADVTSRRQEPAGATPNTPRNGHLHQKLMPTPVIGSVPVSDINVPPRPSRS